MEKKRLITKLTLLFFCTLFSIPSITYAAAGDGLIVYGEDTITTPRYRTYTPTSFAAENNAQDTGYMLIRWATIKTNPGSTERIMGTLGDGASNNLTIQRWNGSSWDSPVEWQATNSLHAYRGLDIAYESLSGRYLVAYSTGSTTVNYQYGSGGSWTSGSFTFTTGIGNIWWIRLAPKLNSNEIALVALGSNTSGTSVNARIWDPATNTFGSEPSGGLGLDNYNTRESFDAVYETASGDLMIAWGKTSSPYWNYATREGSTWTVVTNPTALGGIIRQLALAASPLGTSDRIALAAKDSGSDLQAGRWDGSAWILQNDLDPTTSGSLTRNMNVVFAGTTDNAIIVYGDADTTAEVDWYRSVAGGAFSGGESVDYNPGGTAGNESTIDLTADASSSKVMLLRTNGFYLRAHVYDEASYSASPPYGWSTPTGDDPLETAISGGTAYTSFAFAWETVFKVDALGIALIVGGVAILLAILLRRRVLHLRKPKTENPA